MPKTPITQQMSALHFIAWDPLIILWLSTPAQWYDKPTMSLKSYHACGCSDTHWRHSVPAWNCFWAGFLSRRADHEVPPPEDCQRKWVIVEYDHTKTPTLASLNIDDCGKPHRLLSFGPELSKDICRYEHRTGTLLHSRATLEYWLELAVWELVSFAKHN